MSNEEEFLITCDWCGEEHAEEFFHVNDDVAVCIFCIKKEEGRAEEAEEQHNALLGQEQADILAALERGITVKVQGRKVLIDGKEVDLNLAVEEVRFLLDSFVEI